MWTALVVTSGTLALMAALALLDVPDLGSRGLERRFARESARFLELDGLRLHYRDEGQGAALVLLHGLTANLFVWDAWAECLRQHIRVIRLDLPGHGLTGPDAAQRYGWPDLAERVESLLDRLGIARATVVGNSLGGAVAWQLAARHPQRVARLVLIAPIGYPFEGTPPLIFRLLAKPVLGPLMLRLTYRRAFIDRMAATYGDPRRLDRDGAERDHALFRRAGNRAAILSMLRGGSIPDPRPQLKAIEAPTLIMWGSLDRVTPPLMAQRFAADIQDARIVVLEGAGHAPMQEMPAESLAALRHFIAASEAHEVPAAPVSSV